MEGDKIMAEKTIRFKFEPMQYVNIIAFGLNCEARVLRCTHGISVSIYDVEYALNCTIYRREFYEDELEEKKP